MIFLIHALSIATLASALYIMGVNINKSRQHVFTPEDYAAALKSGNPLPITQQITNVYQAVSRPDKAPLAAAKIQMGDFPEVIDFVNVPGETLEQRMKNMTSIRDSLVPVRQTLHIWNGKPFVDIRITNPSKTTIVNGEMSIISTATIDPITTGGKVFDEHQISYSIDRLHPYSETSSERNTSIQITNYVPGQVVNFMVMVEADNMNTQMAIQSFVF